MLAHATSVELAQQGAAARRDHAQVSAVVLVERLAGELEDALEHDRDDDQRRAPVLRGRAEGLLGVELAAQDQRRAESHAEREVHEAPRVEHGRGDQRGLACA
jgi:hypothetical protein